ncbi:SdpI family protein [Gordonia sp. HY285]|uniref:SdpI family protein n=1 Tax=Gordonia liuliyuniae TaxID=2911517 RepID=UPI001F3D9D52|nr:SdpI family protein [Gordonia liuliyuniae]MCF8609083.1 SdpI family protein [Gordonia liuliyuniae]
MHILSIVSGVLALVLAVFWAGVGISGLSGRLERNRWFGVRSEETMRSGEAFALGNKVAAPGFLAAALVLLIGGVLAFGGDLGFLFGFGGVIVAFVIAAVAAGVGVRVAATVPEPEEESGGCSADCCSGGADEQHADDPAADCGTDSCGSCALQGMCTTEHAAEPTQPADAAH